MKPATLALALCLASSGCATRSEPAALAWELKPIATVRHGMDQARASYQLGRLLQKEGRLQAAEEAYGQAVAADPDHADALNALAALYAERGELERAADMLRQLAALAPQKAYLHNNMGYAFHLLGRDDEAIEALRRAVALDPGYERAWVNLRTVALARGRPDLAAMAVRHELNVPARPAAVETAPSSEPPVVLTMSATFVTPALPAAVPGRGIQLSEAGPRIIPAANPMQGTRVEISNGNGSRGMATLYGQRLRRDGVGVSRITNHSSFRFRRSLIQYSPGFAAAAESLRVHLGTELTPVEMKIRRPGTDVRVILGRDSSRRMVAEAGRADDTAS
ncbi:LytR C-terminal domain-containing protein [Zoogloea sp.]|uniref:LytR C-terminal domain-containing protein n=1 Tax=Zoogloea sp. TaxID=49181 RepID=UPI001415631C|nr:MAG: tetratricopeptide repeat protein [Zoogloea sp.]